jgi:hypothetical protein
MITLQSAENALKSYYLEAVSAQLDTISPFMAAIEKSSEGVYGKDVKFTIIKQGADGVFACNEDDDLPKPYQNEYCGVTVPLKNFYGTIEISDKVLRAANAEAGFIDVLNTEMEGLVANAKDTMSRMVTGLPSGNLAVIDGTAPASNKLKTSAVYYLKAGMTVNVYKKDGSVLASNVTVKKVDRQTGVIEFTGATFSTSTDFTGGYVRTTAPEGAELTGLYDILLSDTLYGMDRAENDFLTPYSEVVAEDISEDNILAALDKMEADGCKPDMILCSFKMRRAIVAVLTKNKSVVNTTELEGGFTAITFNGIPVVADKYIKDGYLYFVNTEDFGIRQLCDWEWLEDEDGKILKQIPGKAAYSATLVKYAELICTKPWKQGVAQFTKYIG